MSSPIEGSPELLADLRELIDASRAGSLWYLRPDYYPSGAEEIERTLLAVERSADRETYVRVRRLRQWLSPDSSAKSAAS